MRTAEFRARAGALTVLFLCSVMERRQLLQMLAESGLPQGERSELPDPDEEVDMDQVLDTGEGPAFVTEPDKPGPGAEMEITPAGVEMHYTGTRLEGWLAGAPGGPLELGEEEAALAIAGLVYGWSTTLTHTLALAPQPLGLAELDLALASVSFAALEEHVDLMESSGLLEGLIDGDGETRYAVTDFLREGIAPLSAGARVECHYPTSDTSPPDRLDVEAAFQLALPLLELPKDVTGTCRLGVHIDGKSLAAMAGATVTVEQGRIVSSTPQLREGVEGWASASAVDWLDTVVEPTVARVEMGGDEHLAASLLAGLHERLFS